MVRRIFLAALLLCAAPLARASAHAMLEHANPPVGGSVATSPKQLELSFSEAVVPHFCDVQVADPSGRAVQTGALATASGGRVLIVPLPPLAPGEYTVRWQAVSVDTHRTEGRFGFRVGQ
jgi:methionine-rich copper-binding protein CopC